MSVSCFINETAWHHHSSSTDASFREQIQGGYVALEMLGGWPTLPFPFHVHPPKRVAPSLALFFAPGVGPITLPRPPSSCRVAQGVEGPASRYAAITPNVWQKLISVLRINSTPRGTMEMAIQSVSHLSSLYLPLPPYP